MPLQSEAPRSVQIEALHEPGAMVTLGRSESVIQTREAKTIPWPLWPASQDNTLALVVSRDKNYAWPVHHSEFGPVVSGRWVGPVLVQSLATTNLVAMRREFVSAFLLFSFR